MKRYLILALICWAICGWAVAYAGQDTQLFVVDEPVTATRPETGEEQEKIDISGIDLWISDAHAYPNGSYYTHDGTGITMLGEVRAAAAGKQGIRLKVPDEYSDLLSTKADFYAWNLFDAAVKAYVAAVDSGGDRDIKLEYFTMVLAHRGEAAGEDDDVDPTGQYKTYDVTLNTYVGISDPNKVLIRAYIPYPVDDGNQGNAYEYNKR